MAAKNNKDTQITVRLEISTKNDLQKLADKSERKLADYIRIRLNEIIREEKKKS